MSLIANINLDYMRPIKLAEQVYWVGFHDKQSGAQANPYLIIDGDEAVVIDGGSRSAFPTVMMKVMQTGITPSGIAALIYQSYDPRLCGSLPHLASLIDRDDLKIISDRANHMFIQHYAESGTLLSLEDIGHEFRFSSGRKLQFHKTPYAHSAGSFITFDPHTEILFTGDLFSSYFSNWELLFRVPSECRKCRGQKTAQECGDLYNQCRIRDILDYHREIMTSERALKLAVETVAAIPFSVIAPHPGSIIFESRDIILTCELLASLQGVGIDGVIGNRSFNDLGKITALKERLG
jgi:flavorubredoxin